MEKAKSSRLENKIQINDSLVNDEIEEPDLTAMRKRKEQNRRSSALEKGRNSEMLHSNILS